MGDRALSERELRMSCVEVAADRVSDEASADEIIVEAKILAEFVLAGDADPNVLADPTVMELVNRVLDFTDELHRGRFPERLTPALGGLEAALRPWKVRRPGADNEGTAP